jgi:hypothetical protein
VLRNEVVETSDRAEEVGCTSEADHWVLRLRYINPMGAKVQVAYVPSLAAPSCGWT